jgi:sodium pump decarboxylase gamma subunit
MTILERFADPNLLTQMTAGEKFTAAMITTGLGMGITFMALVLLWGVIIVMTKLLNPEKEKASVNVVEKPAPVQEISAAEETVEGISGELVAVISAAIAASMNTSIHNIVVRNVVRTSNQAPAWNSAGQQEQMNARF